MTLYKRSLEIIRQFQSPEGAYIACPNFPTYHYSWMRDSSYVAYAMDLAGAHDSAHHYHTWAANTIDHYQYKIPVISAALESGLPLKDANFLFTRYTLGGKEDRSAAWGNFQYDGYGTWLWSVCEHYRMAGDKTWLRSVTKTIQLILTYLQLVWRLPNYDCWEENPDLLHPYSIASTYGGLGSVLRLIEDCEIDLDPAPIKASMQEMKDFVLKNGLSKGCLVKHINTDPASSSGDELSIDASLLGAAIPGMLFLHNDPIIRTTITAIQQRLVSEAGGVYRYEKDTYYGGGQWILLAAWLGWVECSLGQQKLAEERLAWIEKQADENGWLPEQVPHNLLAPHHYNRWLKTWGEIAKPLLWSHAMYVILNRTLSQT